MRFVFFFQIYENAFQLLHFLSGKTFLFENGYGPVVAHCCETENDFIVVDDGDDDDVFLYHRYVRYYRSPLVVSTVWSRFPSDTSRKRWYVWKLIWL